VPTWICVTKNGIIIVEGAFLEDPTKKYVPHNDSKMADSISMAVIPP
jgi:hypothetical protein